MEKSVLLRVKPQYCPHMVRRKRLNISCSKLCISILYMTVSSLLNMEYNSTKIDNVNFSLQI